ncbi:MAG TPA: hypothetical protein VNK05_04060, partial [Chloroflexota bacterium]|nr:hypothetical protein [Chloroflexota bacterium]
MSSEDRAPGQQPSPPPRPPQDAGPEPDGADPAGPEDERLRILRLVAQGRVTATEAAELLGALEPEPPGPPPG